MWGACTDGVRLVWPRVHLKIEWWSVRTTSLFLSLCLVSGNVKLSFPRDSARLSEHTHRREQLRNEYGYVIWVAVMVCTVMVVKSCFIPHLSKPLWACTKLLNTTWQLIQRCLGTINKFVGLCGWDDLLSAGFADVQQMRPIRSSTSYRKPTTFLINVGWRGKFFAQNYRSRIKVHTEQEM